MNLLIGTGSCASDVAHGPLVCALVSIDKNYQSENVFAWTFIFRMKKYWMGMRSMKHSLSCHLWYIL